MLKRGLAVIGPGMLVAATGVGAGDLATAGFSGAQLGTAVLWAVALGGAFKYLLNEGLARWQLSTGTTFIDGVTRHLGRTVAWVFLPYLVLWSYFVGAALMGACGVALYAIFPVFAEASTGKLVFGIVASLAGLLLVRAGGFRVFESVMAGLIGLMFVSVLGTAVILWPGLGPVARGILVPSIPDASDGGLAWTIALIGGVGGTVTILCYGYWIREKGREGASWLRTCRLDLGVGYAMTVLFGLAMVIIGSHVSVSGGGADLLVRLADALEGAAGPGMRWVFLAGALAAVFSSLLGVWQAVPYLFADVLRGLRNAPESDLSSTRAFRLFQLALATVPMLGLLTSFRQAQLLYAIAGAAFLPLLAVALLLLNGRSALVGGLRNSQVVSLGLLLTLGFFVWAGVRAL